MMYLQKTLNSEPSTTEPRDHFILQLAGEIHEMRGNAPEANDQILIFFGLYLCFFQLLRIGYVWLMLHATRLEIAVQKCLEGLFFAVALEDRVKYLTMTQSFDWICMRVTLSPEHGAPGGTVPHQ